MVQYVFADEATAWGWFREQLTRDAAYVAKMTGIKQLANLDKMDLPRPSLRLSRLLQVYKEHGTAMQKTKCVSLVEREQRKIGAPRAYLALLDLSEPSAIFGCWRFFVAPKILASAGGSQAMAEEQFINMTFDDRLDSYKSFFDHEWSRNFLDVSARSRLREAGLILSRDWKSAAMAARTPYLIIESLRSFYEGFTAKNPNFHERLTSAFGKYVTEKSTLSNMRRKEMQGIIMKLGADVEETMKKNPPPFDVSEIWKGFTQENEFKLSLWNLQRTSYTAVYCAYENFIQRVVEAGRNDPDYRARRLPDLKADFRALFGEPLAADCVDDPDVRTATLVRNCLSHDGGRESERLRAVKHGISVIDGQIQLLPEHVRGVFDLLKGKALKIAETAATTPTFN